MSDMVKIASFFRSMQIGTSGGAGKVHATIGSMLNNGNVDFSYIQMEDKAPRYEHSGHIIDLQEQFYEGFGVKKIFSLFKLAFIIKGLCEKNSFDVIIGQGDFFFMVTGLSRLFGNKTKCVALVHTTLRIRPKFIQYILAVCLKMNDYVVCISQDEKRYLGTLGIHDKKITLIHNSIDVQGLILKGLKDIDSGDQYLFDRGIFTFITVGRFTDQKNFKLLIDSYIDYRQISKKESQLIIIGDGEYYDKYCDYVGKSGLGGFIHLIGRRNNPMSYLKRSHCFVLSSKFEGYPMVLLEACVAELPIVSMNCPTGPAELLNESNGGILVPFADDNEADKKSLSKALFDLECQDVKILGNNNRNYVARFDNSVIADKRLTYIHEIVNL